MIVAISILTGLAIYNAASNRLRDRADAQRTDRRPVARDRRPGPPGGRGRPPHRRIGDAGRQIADSRRGRPATEAITAELGELGTLVKQLAETVAVHELKFAKLQGAAPRRDEPPQCGGAVPERGSRRRPPRPAGNTGRGARADMIETIRNAIDANRVDLYLQPIVTLPQRKVRYYESADAAAHRGRRRAAAGRLHRAGRGRRLMPRSTI